MATDYDAPRASAGDEIEADSLEGLKAAEAENSSIDEDGDIIDSFQPPTVDVSGEEISVTVVPRQSNEFTCSSCFIVQDKKRIAHTDPDGSAVCLDCD